MSDWTDGYVADLDYTFGYYTELNPQRLRLAFLNTGLQFPEVGTACELGFGQGMSVNVHAAASVVQWFGTDFNPSQTHFAQNLANITGANAQLCADAFADFCQRTDLPEFDYIALHGVWSWINDENRAVIVDFLQRKLKVGGVLYLSYNTQAGWANMIPMRDLLLEYADSMGTRAQGVSARFDASLQFAEKLFATNPSYVRLNPLLTKRLETLKTQDNRYLVHEYFNRDWHPLSFSKTAGLLSAAKLSFACSAYYFDHVNPLNLTDEQQALLADISDVSLRETVRDFCINQQFRRDYWVKGAVKLTALEQIERLRAERFILIKARDDIAFTVTGGLGESVLHADIYQPILEAFSDYQAKTLAQIEQAVAAAGINLDQSIQAIMVLIGAGALCAVQSADVIAQASVHTQKFNAYLCHKARGSHEIAWLASPVTGGGISVPRFSQLFLLARWQEGYTEPEQWAHFVWSILVLQNQCVMRNGIAIESENDNIAELLVQAQDFATKQLPILSALGIA